jgi:hypothetical protein
MLQAIPLVDRRQHPRAQLSLPLRLRWLGPFRSEIEITQSLDVSREGLLFYRPEPCPLRSRVWATLPFDLGEESPQPETPGRVVRLKKTRTGGYLVGVHLENPRRRRAVSFWPERRASPRVPLSLPIGIRTEGEPWSEESVTVDVSDVGLRFPSARVYSVGDSLRVKLSWGKWEYEGEILAHVARVSAAVEATDAPFADIAIALEGHGKLAAIERTARRHFLSEPNRRGTALASVRFLR